MPAGCTQFAISTLGIISGTGDVVRDDVASRNPVWEGAQVLVKLSGVLWDAVVASEKGQALSDVAQ